MRVVGILNLRLFPDLPLRRKPRRRNVLAPGTLVAVILHRQLGIFLGLSFLSRHFILLGRSVCLGMILEVKIGTE